MKHAEKLTPYPRQEVTIQRILDEPTRAALLADETGAGKTLQASEIILRSNPRRALIIGVGRTFTQWESRLHAQSDGAITLRRLGSKGDELANFEAFLNGDDGVYFSTIQWLMTRDWITVDHERKQTDVFRKMCNRKRGGIDLLVFDESHAIANRNSRGRRTLVTFKSSEGELPMMKIAMSATWAGNSFDNAWSTTRWLWPDLIEPYWTWRELWCSESPVTKADGKPLYVDGKLKVTVTGEKDPEGSFVKKLPCYIRHESEQRAPEPIEILVDSTPEQRQQYSDLKTDLLTWAQTWTGECAPLMVDIPGALYSRLRQVTLAQLSIEPGNGDDIPDRVYFADDAPSGKLRALKGVLNGWGDQPVLLFTDSKLFAKLTAKRMTEAGYRAEAWTGDTSAKEQERIKSGFGREFKYLVATVQAAGTGLDGLQHVCSKILWLSMPPGNSLLREQGEGRIFRSGMTEEFGEFEQVTLLMRDSLDVEVLEDLVSNALHMRSSLTLAS